MKNPFFIVLIILVLPFALMLMPALVLAAAIGGIFFVIHEWIALLSHKRPA